MIFQFLELVGFGSPAVSKKAFLKVMVGQNIWDFGGYQSAENNFFNSGPLDSAILYNTRNIQL